MSKIAIILAGVPGTGKTTLMKRIIKDLGGWTEEVHLTKLIPSMYMPDHHLQILGKYDLNSAEVFQGTDRLSMAVQPEFESFLQMSKSCIVMFEGDRLLTNKTIDSLFKFNFKVFLFVLSAPQEQLMARYKERGSNQTEQFLEGRATKIDNITSRFDLLDCTTILENKDEEDLRKNAQTIVNIILANKEQQTS